MRNKKSLLSLCLLALVLVLGVGYAVVTTQNLSITGSASTVNSGPMNVYFSSVSEDTTTGSDTVSATGAVTTDKLVASINVTGLAAIGDTAELTYTITNDEKDLAAEISKTSVTVEGTVAGEDGTKPNLSSYYEVTTSLDSANVTAAKDGGTVDVTITVELIKLPIEESESTANITVGFVANPVQPN